MKDRPIWDMPYYDVEREMKSKVDGFDKEAQVMCWKLMTEIARLRGIIDGYGIGREIPVFDPDTRTPEECWRDAQKRGGGGWWKFW